ncbi:MAG: hypothetical protein ACRD28_14740, partial [Acidobacteriaceae bacterium]
RWKWLPQMNINTQPAANGYENNQREQQIRSVSAFFRSLFSRCGTRIQIDPLPVKRSPLKKFSSSVKAFSEMVYIEANPADRPVSL